MAINTLAGSGVEKKKKEILPTKRKPVTVPVVPQVLGTKVETQVAPTAPVVPTGTPGNIWGITDPAELKARQLEEIAKQGLDPNTGQPFKEDATTVTPDVTPTPTGPSQADIVEGIRQKKLADARSRFDVALGLTTSRLGAEEAALAPEFRERRGRVQTQDVMAREAAKKLQATQGLAGAGTASQTGIAQSVITGGAIGALNQQELAAKADIQRRLSDAVQLRNQGVATAESAADIASMEFQLEQITQQENAALKQAEINDQREYDDFVRQIEQRDEQEMKAFENELEQENTLLDAQIQELRDNRDFAQAQELQRQKEANDIKLQGIRDAAAIARVRTSGAQAKELQELRGEQSLADIEARATEARETAEFKEGLGEELEEEVVTPEFRTEDIISAFNDELRGLTFNDRKRKAAQLIVERMDNIDINQVESLFAEYAIRDIDELFNLANITGGTGRRE